MPTASQLLAELPPQPGELGSDGIPERDRIVLDMLYGGFAPPYEWVQLVSASELGILRVLVGADALKIGDESDALRPNLCHLAAQEFCDRNNCVLLTPKLNDLVWAQSSMKIAPSNINPYPAAATDAMVQHSRMVDEKLPPGFPANMLVPNVGKGAVNSTLLWAPAKPAKMAIYGWHTTSPAVAPPAPGPRPAVTPDGANVIQPESIKHVAYFEDYSATVRVMRREAELSTDGGTQIVDVADIAQDPELWPLVNASGPIIMRHPGVPCPSTVAGSAAPPAACPVPPGAAPPSPGVASKSIPTGALVVGGVALALGVAYYTLRS